MVYNQRKNMISCPYLTKRTKAALFLLNGAHPAKRSVVDVLAHVRSTAARAFHAFTTFLLMKIKGIITEVSVCHTFPPPCIRIFCEHIFNLHIWLTYPFATPGDGEFLVSLLHALMVKDVLAGGTPSSVLG